MVKTVSGHPQETRTLFTAADCQLPRPVNDSVAKIAPPSFLFNIDKTHVNYICVRL